MILNVVKYGHPALRKKGARIENITPAVRQFIADMFETMYASHGIGLAAQQVGEPLQLTVIDVREAVDRPSTLELDGQPAPVDDFMPLVLINPEIKPYGDKVKTGEVCLSFPEVFGDIERPEFVEVKALDKNFKSIEFCAGGLLARAVQHEVDHLNGILFIDRMDKKTKEELRDQLAEIQMATKAEMQKK